ncbi:Exosome complex component CSL4 [Trichoplax sp. H2]|nr:Exosome complex component CSL4 [Trichoplax sp. H2]|eukprot:RDD41649.1 Exosome complex component CSL4 [Trichoplax sp. H2]
MAAEVGNPVIPGQRLGSIDQFSAGLGTYVRQRHIYASLVGYKDIISQAGQLPKIQIKTGNVSCNLPTIGKVVTAKVLNVNPRFCRVLIICTGTTPLKEPFKGTIRKEDIRATEKDKVDMYNCFKPGDAVLAEVISLGDPRSYYLSTAKNELGVIFAKSTAGHPMIPISWTEMQCPHTEKIELRKVARIKYWTDS